MGLTAISIAVVAATKTERRVATRVAMIFSGAGAVIGILATVLLFSSLLDYTPSSNPGSVRADTTRSVPAPQRGVPVGDAEIDAEINDAIAVVSEYWSDNFSRHYPGRLYEAPRVGGAYTSEWPASCGGQEIGLFNSYYCAVDHTIWWDAELMKAAYSAGDAVVYLIVAHEWGHAIQAQNGDVWMAAELQADCFAAAALYGAEADGYFIWEPGDTAEITHALTVLADETAWTNTTDHGDPLDRIDAFNEGRVWGVEGCYSVPD